MSKPRQQILTVRNIVFSQVEASTTAIYDGWHRRHLRCTKETFNAVVDKIRQRHPGIHHNARSNLRIRVACTLHYFSHPGALKDTAALFGISTTSVHRYLDEVTSLIDSYRDTVIRWPDNERAWSEVATGFKAIAGVPNVVGAIDGSLIDIKRITNYQGFYSRKMTVAVNVQGVVDHKKRFIDIHVGPGSYSDKKLFKHSTFGQTIHSHIPQGTYFLADGGYTLLPHVMTPYRYKDNMPHDQAHYNFHHSRTRMKVECAFGLWKEKFRIFKASLLQNNVRWMSTIIVATAILHNWFIDAEDDVYLQYNEDVHVAQRYEADDMEPNENESDVALRRQEWLKRYIKNHIQ